LSFLQLIAGRALISPQEVWTREGKLWSPAGARAYPPNAHTPMSKNTMGQSSWTAEPQDSPAYLITKPRQAICAIEIITSALDQ